MPRKGKNLKLAGCHRLLLVSGSRSCPSEAPLWRHKAKVKLGPTESFGRDALRRVLADWRLLVNDRGAPVWRAFRTHYRFAFAVDSKCDQKLARDQRRCSQAMINLKLLNGLSRILSQKPVDRMSVVATLPQSALNLLNYSISLAEQDWDRTRTVFGSRRIKIASNAKREEDRQQKIS